MEYGLEIFEKSNEKTELIEIFGKEVLRIMNMMKEKLTLGGKNKFEGIDQAIDDFVVRMKKDMDFDFLVVYNFYKSTEHIDLFKGDLSDCIENITKLARLLLTINNSSFFDSEEAEQMIVKSLYIANFMSTGVVLKIADLEG